MGKSVPNIIDDLVDEEIRRQIADALEDGSILSTSTAAVWIMRSYPNSGLDERRLADRLIMAAAAAGVAVEIGRPGPESA